MVGVVAVAAMLLVGLARLGAGAADGARAQNAADAAALAGAAEGEGAARELAIANGAELVRFEVVDGDVVVEVRLGDASATARARRVDARRT